MSSMIVRPGSGAILSKEQMLTQAHQLGVPLRAIGKSHAPIVPGPLGDDWWLEVYRPETVLPLRARQRLQALLDAGVRPKAIVVFHEIPGTAAASSPLVRMGRRTVARTTRWVSEELPIAADLVKRSAVRAAPIVGQALVSAAALTVVGVGVATFALIQMLGAVAALDPCLVIVTQDGCFWEVDRWYS